MRVLSLSRTCVLLASLVVLATALSGQTAFAQGFGFFGNLFGGLGQQQPSRPSYPGYGNGYNAPRDNGYDYYERPRRRTSRRVTNDPAVREASPKPAIVKHPTLFVDVFGDGMAQMLTGGLDEAYATRADVAVERAPHNFTGLTESDGSAWLKEMAEGQSAPASQEARGLDRTAKAPHEPEPAPRKKIDVAVVLIGMNDRQPIVIDGKSVAFGSAEWKAAYAKRVAAVDGYFRMKKIPLVWVGAPIMKDDDFADAMAALNEIYRDTASKDGAVYVDTWEAFSDDDGDFSPYGPDVNGQTVRLRASDGINFTKAGARKLAHFVEAHITRALEGKVPTPELPATPEKQDAPKVASHPDVGPVHNLNELPSSPSGTLASVDKGPLHPGSDAEPGRGAAPPPNRADSAAWPATAADNR